MKKNQIDVDLLRNLVEVKQLTHNVVAKILGLHRASVYRACKFYNIKTQRSGPRSGELHPEWKGGRSLVGGYWYIYCPDHPNATKAHRVAEHRLVMEDKLGRYLLRSEVVHHLNGNSQDNTPDNLELFVSNAEHLKTELKGRCPKWTAEGVERMRQANISRDRTYMEKTRIFVDHELFLKLIEEDNLIKSEIACKLGISVTTLGRHCMRHGISLNWKSRRSRLQNSNRKK